MPMDHLSRGTRVVDRLGGRRHVELTHIASRAALAIGVNGEVPLISTPFWSRVRNLRSVGEESGQAERADGPETGPSVSR